MESDIYLPDQPVHVTIKFENRGEIKDLLDSLDTWTPTQSWSDLALEFFSILRTAINL